MAGTSRAVAIVGGGPAGLIAAERLAGAGHTVTIYDRMPSPGRKFLLAGRGGLNLTHSEPLAAFLARYGEAEPDLNPLIRAFDPAALRDWCHGLGEPTFVGSSGRVFPQSFKASPLLRAWLKRLGEAGVSLRAGRRWTGWTVSGALSFEVPEGPAEVRADAVVLALGGASWPRLGSDGGWVEILEARGVKVSPLRPANAGIDIAWSQMLKARFSGAPLKRIALAIAGRSVRGELVITSTGLEGGAAYALSSAVRRAVDAGGRATVTLDLRPDLAADEIAAKLSSARAGESFANRLRKRLALPPAAVALLHEADRHAARRDPAALAHLIKAAPLTTTGLRPIERAISTAGGVRFDELDDRLMLKRLPGVFCAGEMLDWEAPTGGYLLQASFATGAAAARGVERWLTTPSPAPSAGP